MCVQSRVERTSLDPVFGGRYYYAFQSVQALDYKINE